MRILEDGERRVAASVPIHVSPESAKTSLASGSSTGTEVPLWQVRSTVCYSNIRT